MSLQSHVIGLGAAVLGLLAGCGPAQPPQPPTRRAGEDAGTARLQTPPRMLTLPAHTVQDPERYSFLMFGDARWYRSLCGPERPGTAHCRVRLTPGDERPTRDCGLIKMAPKQMFREVAERITKQPGKVGRRDAFALFNGDLVFRGSCSKDWAWARKWFLSFAPTRRVFPILGNHDVWRKKGEPPALPQYFAAFPHLRVKDGDKTVKPHYYGFRVGTSLFVNLCTGGYTGHTEADFERSDRAWLCTEASYETQMAWMRRVLAWGVRQGVKHVFVQYHKPSLSCSRHPGLDDRHDPLFVLRPFKKKHPSVDVLALSGHNHTTAVYRTGGVLVLVAGGAGAFQYLGPPKHGCNAGKKHRPPELFWKGAPRTTRYNLFRFVVRPEGVTIRERCLSRKRGSGSFQLASAIELDGRIRRIPGACNLATRAK